MSALPGAVCLFRPSATVGLLPSRRDRQIVVMGASFPSLYSGSRVVSSFEWLSRLPSCSGDRGDTHGVSTVGTSRFVSFWLFPEGNLDLENPLNQPQQWFGIAMEKAIVAYSPEAPGQNMLKD